jgi:hypothetical protein
MRQPSHLSYTCRMLWEYNMAVNLTDTRDTSLATPTPSEALESPTTLAEKITKAKSVLASFGTVFTLLGAL